VPVALSLLSLESAYKPAYQLALDMMKRLSCIDRIVDILLIKGQVGYFILHDFRSVFRSGNFSLLISFRV